MIFRTIIIIREFYLFNKYPFTKEFVKFCLVGTTNLVVDFSVYSILTRIFNLYYLAAAVLSFIVAVTWSFYFNKRWTFRDRTRRVTGQYAKFFTANVISLAITLALLYLAVEVGGFNDLLAKAVIAVLVAFVNFSLNKLWTFSRISHNV